MSYRKDAVSLRNVPAYKHIRRRIVEPPANPLLAPIPVSQLPTIATSQPAQSAAPQPSQLQPAQPVSLANLDEVQGEFDEDEYFDPFAAQKGQKADLLQDDYDDDDDDDDDVFLNDGGDDQALLLFELKKIKDEEEKEKEHKIKEEMRHQQQISLGGDNALFTNELMTNKMFNLVKEEQKIKGELKADHATDETQPAPAIKRKKWTEDSVFSNTALSLGDSDMIKKQRLNNDTTNSDKHQQFLSEIFK